VLSASNAQPPDGQDRHLLHDSAMTRTVHRPGIGLLDLEAGPGGLSVWTPRRKPASALYPVEIPVSIVLEGTDLDSVDTALVAEVLDDPDRFLEAGLWFAQAMLMDDVPLDLPQLLFYADREWLMHFRLAEFPGAGPHGLMVVFDRYEPVRIEDTAGDEPID
jgi:hypothetical protein